MLNDRTWRLCRLYSCAVLGDWPGAREVRRSAPRGEPDRAWREALLMLHVFAGFPRTIETFDHLSAEGGVGTPDPDELAEDPERSALGPERFGVIYAAHTGAVQAHLVAHHPTLFDWVSGHVYGRVFGRQGLELVERELLAVAALASLGQERQLASHARGAIRCGAEPEQVKTVLEHLSDQVPESRLARARVVVEKFAKPS